MTEKPTTDPRPELRAAETAWYEFIRRQGKGEDHLGETAALFVAQHPDTAAQLIEAYSWMDGEIAKVLWP